MSTRTYIEETQIFGNNDRFLEFENFLKSSGIEVDEEGSCDGYITDVEGLFKIIDVITRKCIAKRHDLIEKGLRDFNGGPARELTDLSNSIWLNETTPLLWFNMRMIEDAYCFSPYQVYQAIKDKIERSDTPYEDGEMEWWTCSYKIKDGAKIHIYVR